MASPGGSTNSLNKVGLPGLTFMFTLDQISSMMNISENNLMVKYLYYPGRSSGMKARHHMTAVNIAPENEKPEWRVSLEEYRKWLKRMGFRAADITYF